MPTIARLFQLLARVPLSWMQRLGALLGWLVWFASLRYRRTFIANVKASGLPFHLARPAIAAAGMVVSELPWVWMRPHTQTLNGLLKIDGKDIVIEPHTFELHGKHMFKEVCL